ncbi:MAG: recombinase family protein [Clostridia bacterium]|nr:recombinase family protein [Clostridia bacterium]
MTVSRIAAPVQMPKLKRVAAYARVSTGKDAMLHSLAAQVSYYSDLIQRNPEWEYAGVYADENYSGTRDTRPEFQRLLKDCRDGKIDMILVKSISRFARNTVTLLETVRILKEMGISVYFEEQKIDTLSGDGELMLSILASFFQEESRNVSENCKWRVRKKFEQGIPTGFQMYGYDVRNGVFTIIPEEAEVVRRIFRMYLDGMGSVRIMKTLIAEGVPAPEGGLWNASVIMMMLKNEKYAGDLLLQKFFTNNHIEKKQCFNRGELPQYFVEGNHEPIIDRETFDAVQAEIAQRRAMDIVNGGKKAADDAEDYLPELEEQKLSDLPLGKYIHCGICGKKYRRKITRMGTPYAAPIWICGTFSFRGKAYCASKQIPEKILIDLIAGVLGIDSSLTDTEALDRIHHIEMHPDNRVQFVFQDGYAEDHFWKDHSRKDSWDAEKRKKAAEKTKVQHQKRKERDAE